MTEYVAYTIEHDTREEADKWYDQMLDVYRFGGCNQSFDGTKCYTTVRFHALQTLTPRFKKDMKLDGE